MSAAGRISQSSLYTARIRMSRPVWEYIVHAARSDGPDQVQRKLDRLVRENPEANDRILVTNDEDVVDQLRDWCAMMTAEGRQIQSNGRRIAGETLVQEAAKVIAAIDKHDDRLIEARRVFKSR